jgi:hypothetical protein
MADQIETTSNQATRPGEMSNNVLDQISGLLDGVNQTSTKPPPRAKTTKPPEVEKAEETEETEAEEAEEGEAEEAEEGEVEEAEEAEEGEGDVTWAKTLGVDEKHIVLDEEGEFAGVNVKVDGKTETVDLPTLIAGFQSNKSNTNKSKALAEERKVLAASQASLLDEYGAKIRDAVALNNYLETSLLKEYQNVNWEGLRYQNPAEYAALIQDYNIRTDEVNRIKAAITTVADGEMSKKQKEINEQTSLYVQEQMQLAIEKNPEWAKPAVFKKALDSMVSFVEESYGFTPQEFAEVKDARILELIKDAQRYRTGKTVATKKLEKPVAKFQKPTGASRKSITKLEKLTQAAHKASGYHKREAETNAIAELLAGKI